MKKLSIFLLRLIFVSLLLDPVLPPFHQAYKFVLALITTASVPTVEIITAVPPYDSISNIYTYFILILGTPSIPIKKRVVGIVTGIAVFLTGDIFMTSVWTPFMQTPGTSLLNMVIPYSWNFASHYLMPFLLWLAFAFKEIEQLFRGEIVKATKV